MSVPFIKVKLRTYMCPKGPIRSLGICLSSQSFDPVASCDRHAGPCTSVEQLMIESDDRFSHESEL